ncbi:MULTISPECIES: baseplate J/gp47 family protein [Caproicibacterium]|uniref:Baseplate J/gp47 family protein n=1 Tax=Caproicibacterium argilliputei TaxID=3030016 RepID=A0AA97H111_9FIRM|nr:baseplate J/gp47 family protein [Caproicibacterium argilliputei]WOC32146.1 baseplate J/gp47 family protein [Caproicibacterium argilliputei]
MISYEELVQRMNTAYAKETGFAPDAASDTAIRFRVLAGEVYNLLTDLAWLKQSLLPQTAVGGQLDKLAQEHGLQRAQAAQAQGSLQFTTAQDVPFAVVLSAGTQCTTGGENPVLVETLEELRLPVRGGQTAVVQARAVKSGPAGNLAAGAVNALVTANTYVASVTNPQGFSGGRDAQTDSQLRKQLLELGQQQSNGTNLAFYRRLAQQAAGVSSVSVQAVTPAAGEVTVWLAAAGVAAPEEVVQRVQKSMEKARELNVQVHVYPAKTAPVTVAVTMRAKDGQEAIAAAETVRSAVRTGFSGLQIGETPSAAQVCTWIYSTGVVQEAVLQADTVFPAAAADTLVTLKSVEVFT